MKMLKKINGFNYIQSKAEIGNDWNIYVIFVMICPIFNIIIFKQT